MQLKAELGPLELNGPLEIICGTKATSGLQNYILVCWNLFFKNANSLLLFLLSCKQNGSSQTFGYF